ncbi:MAG: hypothetical protein R8G34_18660 [Paracoccaceae bacterium]|nr:hypothetical protein [Paracoccaceae bacterium]
MPLIAIGAVKLKHWIWGPEFFWRTTLSLRQARTNGDCTHAEVFGWQEYYLSLTAWRDGAAMKRYAQSGHHARAMRWSSRIAIPLHFRHVQLDHVPSHAQAFDLWHEGLRPNELPLVNHPCSS